jgi:diguanylate cyclase (GGDEF)-like protein/PAS domain S-box-containing protein
MTEVKNPESRSAGTDPKGIRARAWSVAAPTLVGACSLLLAFAISGASMLQRLQFGLPIVLVLIGMVSAAWLLSLQRISRAAHAQERRFATLLNAAPEAILGISDDGTIRFANAQVSNLFGYAAGELEGAEIELLIPRRFHASHVEARRQFVEQPRMRLMGSGKPLYAQCKSGVEIPVEVSLSRIETGSESIVLCIARDVSGQTQVRETLLEANRNLERNVMEIGRRAEELRQLTGMGELLQCCSAETEVYAVIAGVIARLFPQASGGLYLLDREHSVAERAVFWGADESQLRSRFAPEDCWGLRRGRTHATSAEEATIRCAHIVCAGDRGSYCIPMVAQGETVGVLHTSIPEMPHKDFQSCGQVLRVIAEHGAIAVVNLRLREALRLQSIRDPLTGLYNRRFLDEWLSREITRCRRAHGTLSVLMLDLDHFKQFNDAFGHQGGDVALREVGATLQQLVRGSDVVCRIGGEEIAVLLPDTGIRDAALVGEKLRDAVEHAEVRHNGRPLQAITTSVGVASFPDHADNAEELLQAVDVALYAAKHAGRNCVKCASGVADVRVSMVR